MVWSELYLTFSGDLSVNTVTGFSFGGEIAVVFLFLAARVTGGDPETLTPVGLFFGLVVHGPFTSTTSCMVGAERVFRFLLLCFFAAFWGGRLNKQNSLPPLLGLG